MPDAYDKSIDNLLLAVDDQFDGDFKAAIDDIWGSPDSYPDCGGALFRVVTRSGDTVYYRREDGQSCGCLTEIRRGIVMRNGEPAVAWTDKLTALIKADRRIPIGPEYIQPADLPVFAQWQRSIDTMLGRKQPEVKDYVCCEEY